MRLRRRVIVWSAWALLCVVLGAVTSVGVAWGKVWEGSKSLSLIGVAELPSLDRDGQIQFNWAVRVESGAGVTVKSFCTETGRVSTSEEQAEFHRLTSDAGSVAAMDRHAFLLEGSTARVVEFSVQSAGWPARCLCFEDACTADEQDMEWVLRYVGRARYAEAPHFRELDREPPPQALLDWMEQRQKHPEVKTPLPAGLGETPMKVRRREMAPTYGAWEYKGHLLPVRPLWGGAAVCTAFYGAGWGGVDDRRRWGVQASPPPREEPVRAVRV